MTAPPPKPTEAIHVVYDTGIHKTEAVYSTVFSSVLRLHDVNKFIHSIPSLPYPLEFIVFLFGYSFNPVSIPLWMVAITISGAMPPSEDATISTQMRLSFGVGLASFYLATVLVTLIGTEICKASFRATRPEGILSLEFRTSKQRRFGTLVASLKSKHAFPSGDSAQAANAVLFWFLYIAPLWQRNYYKLDDNMLLLLHCFAFGVFFPGVAFARIFYHCHWIEDCIGGALLAALLHRTVIPIVSDVVWQMADQWMGD